MMRIKKIQSFTRSLVKEGSRSHGIEAGKGFLFKIPLPKKEVCKDETINSFNYSNHAAQQSN